MKKLFLLIVAFINFKIGGESEGLLPEEDRIFLGRGLCLFIYGKNLVESWEANGMNLEANEE